ncbi:MAG: isoprenylcysteine carboxylmethyltransferase family protein [Saprospiraceae bacterium]|nr:isoprenylcysteine carboxylmethyltransferase family protein [Saprospiraceae bacterium]
MISLLLKVFFLIANLIKSAIRWQHIDGDLRSKGQLFVKAWFKNRIAFLAKLGMLGLPLVYIFTPVLGFANYQLPIAINIFGCFLYCLGLLVFYRAHHDLGNNWSPKLKGQAKELITNGIYERVRHPMYSSLWILAMSHPLILTNWIAGFSGLLAFAYFYFKRVEKEEDLLVKQFGKPYWIYMQSTGRVIPKW